MKRNSDLQIKTSYFKHQRTPSQMLFETTSFKSPSNLFSPTNFQNLLTAPDTADSKKARTVKQFLSKHKGSINPITYNTSYGFNESWQSQSKQGDGQNSRLGHTNDKLKILNFIMFPFLIFHFWFTSIYRTFRYQNCQWLFTLGLALEFSTFLYQSIAIASHANWKNTIRGHFKTLIKKKGILLVGSIYSIIYYTIALASTLVISQDLSLIPFDVFLILYKYQVLQQIYSLIRIEAIGSRYKLFMNLFDLASNIFMMIHFFAIMLFLCTYYEPQSNWSTISPINTANNWASQYVQSFYFACTTMLTVGFGDVRPTNLLEISCVLVVQLVGIMNNAYVISQIGANLLLIHEQRNNLYKDIANAQKIIKQDEVGSALGNKMMDYLVNNQPVNDELSIAEEQTVFDKLSEQFKAELKQNTQLHVIKKNLFIISNFTNRFQSEISKKLIKAIYPPHSVLPNNHGKQRLYIITKGAVDIITEKKYKTQILPQKIIKFIRLDRSNSLNAIYGYATLFSGKQTRVKAVASNFSVCYYLENQEILECIQKFPEDSERYFEIKHRLQMFAIPEKYQIPNFISNRQHYVPNIYVLIKKEKINNKANKRRQAARGNRKVGKRIEDFQDESNKTDNIPISSGDSITVSNLQEQTQKRQEETIVMPTMTTPLVAKPRSQRVCSNQRKYQELRKLRLQQKQNQQLHLGLFSQSMKEYKNYFPKSNLKNVAERYNGKKISTEQGQTLEIKSTRLEEMKWKRLKSGCK